MIQEFDIELFDLSKERIAPDGPRICRLSLHDHMVELGFNWNGEECNDEDGLVWESRKTRQFSVFARRQLSTVHYFRGSSERCWTLELEFVGSRQNIALNFKKLENGIGIYNACKQYLEQTLISHELAEKTAEA